MAKAASHCRLFVILAREAHRAVIFRRGPNIWTQQILWDTDTDTFTEGHWLKGKIYTHRCDLSPDGQKLVYFAAKHHRYIPNDPRETTFTAISRPPYYTALAIWGNGGTYGGGGLFEDNHNVYMTFRDAWVQTQAHLFPKDLTVHGYSAEHPLWGSDKIYYNMLPLRGWGQIEGDFRKNEYSVIWQKASPDHRYKLRMMLVEGYSITSKYIFTVSNDKVEFTLDGNEWADWDQRGRLVYTDAGKLFVGTIRADRIEPVELADFNPNKPKLIKSPAWAQTWDQTP